MTETRLTLMEAIARKQTVTAQYNGDLMKLAPHLLFQRRGALFVSALNVRKTWRVDTDRRLGHFKIDGLSAAKLTGEAFEPLPSFQASLPQPDDTLVLTI